MTNHARPQSPPHPRRTWARLAAVSLIAPLALACASSPPPPAPVASAADYAPLPVGGKWTYEVRYPGQTGEMTVELVGEKDGYVIDNKNGALRHTQQGLRDRDRYLIRHPLKVGTKWQSVVGPSAVEHLEITKVGESCDSATGRFDDCIEVSGWIRRDKTMTLHIKWLWAKAIGLVGIETEAEIEGKGRVPQVKQTLKTYALEPAPPKPDDDGPDTWTAE